MGIENTFSKDHCYGVDLFSELDRLIDGLLARLKRADRKGRTVTLKVKFSDFQQVTRSVTATGPFLTADDIAKLARLKLSEFGKGRYKDKKVRLLGISISNFVASTKIGRSHRQLDMYHFLDDKASQSGRPSATSNR